MKSKNVYIAIWVSVLAAFIVMLLLGYTPWETEIDIAVAFGEWFNSIGTAGQVAFIAIIVGAGIGVVGLLYWLLKRKKG